MKAGFVRRVTSVLAAATALLLMSAASPSTASLDAIARDYVRLILEAGEREPEYVDAYYGPPEWAAAAKAHPREVAQLRADARALRLKAEQVPIDGLTPLERQRRRFLIGQLGAAETRLAIHAGEKFDFDDEAERLFGVRPKLAPLATYDGALSALARLVPGQGPLWERVDAYRARFNVPADKVEAVVHAAISECRRRTIAHIQLPASEKFTLQLVTGKPWIAYNFYKGNSVSLIQINTDLPLPIDNAIYDGCHEGYPGHHVYNMLLEQELVRKRGWVEYTVYPLYSPQSFIAEGSADFGINLAFPGHERAAFAARTLFPIAGFDPAEAVHYEMVQDAVNALSGARLTIDRDYLDGRIDRTRAIELKQTYGLMSRAKAETSIAFADHYRSYVINYGIGSQMVSDAVNAAGPQGSARWAKMGSLLSRPTTPHDLRQQTRRR